MKQNIILLIDSLMLVPSDRLDSPFLHSKMLIMSSNERLRKYNAQLMKFQVLYFLGMKKKIWKELLFSLLNAKRFWNNAYNNSSLTMYKNWSCSLRISSVNVTKSAENCRFGHIYWRNP